MNDQLEQILSKLSQNIRRYVILESVALIVLLLGLFFWGSFLLDWAYFKLWKLELPVLLRQIILFLMLGGLAYAVIRWLLLRIALPMRDRALALVLEKRFTQLDDRLITAVEMPQVEKLESPVSQRLLEKTIQDAREIVNRLNLSEVFNQFPLRRAITLAMIAMISIFVMAISNQAALARWAKGYLLFQERYWERKTSLEAQVIAQPGDRVRQFHQMEYKHPRGEDLTILVKALEGSIAPERVTLKYKTSDGVYGRVVMSTIEQGVYRHTITNVMADMQIHLLGGDFSTYAPYKVTIVEPPQVDAFMLWCHYPDYTNLNKVSEQGLPPYSTSQLIQGLSTNVPVGTRFLLSIRCNKNLQAMEVRTTRFEMKLNHADKSASGWQEEGILLNAEGVKQKDFKRSQPAEITGHIKDQQTVELLCEIYPDDKISAAIEQFDKEPFAPIPLSLENNFKIYLEDSDEVLSVEPVQCKITGILDQEPTIDILPKGIGQAITRKASIPIVGKIIDDYGLTGVKFVYGIDKDEIKTETALKQNAQGVKEFKIGDTIQTRERFEVLPLNLNINQRILLTLEATDGDTVTGPHIAKSKVMEFRIVSEEDLLSLLFQKELNLRKRFEQIIEEVKIMKEDLIKHRDLYAAGVKDGNAVTKETSNAIISAAERSVYTTRQKATEVQEIQVSFEDIREELINNNLDNQSANDRLNNKIITPLDRICKTNFPRTDEQVGIFKLVAEREQNPLEPINNTLLEVELLQKELQKVLEEMQQLENFMELIELLKGIVNEQEQLKKMTEEEKKKKLIELQDLM